MDPTQFLQHMPMIPPHLFGPGALPPTSMAPPMPFDVLGMWSNGKLFHICKL